MNERTAEQATEHDLRVENERLRADLARAREEVARQQDFLAIVAHELRNPITPVAFAVDLLLRQTSGGRRPSEETLLRRLRMFGRQVYRLKTDLDRLLDFSRIRSGRLTLVLEEVDLAAVLAETVDEMRPWLEACGAELKTSSSGPAVGRWDRMRLRQVAWNLISNAAKYGAGEPIHAAVTADADRAFLTVSDRGPGIPDHERARIFSRFERARSERPHTGFGVGLWLVKQITEALGGAVRFESVPGAGTTFTVDLPRKGHVGR
jgi:signal transduction histidine kinase